MLLCCFIDHIQFVLSFLVGKEALVSSAHKRTRTNTHRNTRTYITSSKRQHCFRFSKKPAVTCCVFHWSYLLLVATQTIIMTIVVEMVIVTNLKQETVMLKERHTQIKPQVLEAKREHDKPEEEEQQLHRWRQYITRKESTKQTRTTKKKKKKIMTKTKYGNNSTSNSNFNGNNSPPKEENNSNNNNNNNNS